MTREADSPTLVWFRNDLRLRDNPALDAAARRGRPITPVFISDPDSDGDWPIGAAKRWWLHQTLSSLITSLHRHRSRLVILRGDPLTTLRNLVDATNADAVYWNRAYEPAAVKRDTAVKSALRDDGVEIESFNGSLLFEPWEIRTKSQTPYQVFTPFWRACCERPAPALPLDEPSLTLPDHWPKSLDLDDLELEPTIDWADGMRQAWDAGEEAADERLKQFVRQSIAEYDDARDRPDTDGTSRISPYLALGVLSPRQVWHTVRKHVNRSGKPDKRDAASAYLREVGWREFAYHLLYHFPDTPTQPLRDKFASFPWQDDDEALRRWQRGRTGYPIVDAGMRQLWRIGWMHNRVRMIVASFLVKDLLLPWQRGAEWFWDTLIDADLANNTLGWQWIAGCGADAAPYFRVFNPISQGKKFDPQGQYVRQWVPELSEMPDRWIHNPWEAPAGELDSANVTLGTTYPEPIVDHAEAREKALAAFEDIKSG